MSPHIPNPLLPRGATLTEIAIFDVATGNAQGDFCLPTTIPTDKIELQKFITRVTAGAKVTVLPAQELHAPKPWKAGERKPANDNRQLVSWPLLEKLKRDGLHEDAELIEHYRGLASLMELEPLQGRDPSGSADGLVHETRSTIDPSDVDEAAVKGWQGKKVAGGDLSWKELRQAAKAPGTASQAKQTDEKTVTVMRPMSLRFNERNLVAQIDMRGLQSRLHAALGPLVAPFEDAVLDGATFGQIGEARHFKGKQAEAVGKALVMIGLDAVRAAWRAFRDEERNLEEQAERNVKRWEVRRAKRQAAYLGRAA